MPAKKKAEDAILTPATPVELIKGLIQALGHDPATVGAVEVSGRYVRVLGKDRSLRSHRVEGWNAAEVADDSD